jgi:hypothetical protein
VEISDFDTLRFSSLHPSSVRDVCTVGDIAPVSFMVKF